MLKGNTFCTIEVYVCYKNITTQLSLKFSRDKKPIALTWNLKCIDTKDIKTH